MFRLLAGKEQRLMNLCRYCGDHLEYLYSIDFTEIYYCADCDKEHHKRVMADSVAYEERLEELYGE
jgi:hypothetical protein